MKPTKGHFVGRVGRFFRCCRLIFTCNNLRIPLIISIFVKVCVPIVGL
nr:MAG TPA: hypothetical protein [Caudoviricetes sp.]